MLLCLRFGGRRILCTEAGGLAAVNPACAEAPQCTAALHVVRQAPGKPLVSVLNCLAEIVLAQRTVATMVAKNVVLAIFLSMVRGSFP